MAYYSGTASTLANLLTALTTNAVADGWTLTGNVLSKAGVYFQLTADSKNVICLGCEDNAVSNPAPNVVGVGRIWENFYTGAKQEISFPCNYEIFGFAQELYLVANYDVDAYQWLAFGKSTVPGLSGQGGWCAASVGGPFDAATLDLAGYINMSATQGGAGTSGVRELSPCAFWTTEYYTGNERNAWVNHGLDSHGWKWGSTASVNPIGIQLLAPLIAIQPNAWNSEAALLPIRAYKERPSYKSSLVVDLEFARHLRIDNLSPGDILTLGSDQWKVFPWHRKNSAARNGGVHINHTGTFGWAIRYEGP